jgi:CheY-like chemotaxis protein
MRHDRANHVCIAIIDDNPGSVVLMSSELAACDVEVLSAIDPEEGLDLIFRRHPQLVVTDLVMPKMSGMQVLERIVVASTMLTSLPLWSDAKR